MDDTYVDIRTGQMKVRHTDWGATPVALPSNEWSVGNSQSELQKALDAAQEAGGGTLKLTEDVFINSPVKWVSTLRTVSEGASIKASGDFSGNYLINVLDIRDSWFDGVGLHGGNKEANGFSIRETHNCIWSNIDVRNCGKAGIYIEDGSSDLTFVGGESHDNGMHGLAIDDKESKRIAILSMRLHKNRAFGLDTHGTDGEGAGLIIEGNGLNTDKYLGVCVKAPEAVDWRIHDSDLRNSGEGYGCFWTYEIERRPSGVMVYRCNLIGGPHYYSGKNGEIIYYDNTYLDVGGTPVGMRVRGPGTFVEDPTLSAWPNLADPPDPVDPVDPVDPGTSITREEAITLFRELFSEEIEKVYLDVELGLRYTQ